MRNLLNIKSLITSLALLFVVLMPNQLCAQKFAYIDSDYVLLHLPDFAAAQQELNTYAIEWQADIESKNSRQGADAYAQEVLYKLEQEVSDVLSTVRRGIEVLDLEQQPASGEQEE